MSIEERLKLIADLLDAHGEAGWANTFRNFLTDYKSEPGATKGKIRSVYGGMGSFSDVVLYGPNGFLLRDENDKLDLLRSDLFMQCQAKS